MAITTEQLEALIRNLTPRKTEKHFTHCPARFNGTRTREAVDDFLSSADFFKSSEGITDENAVKGLALLLQETAHTWWSGIRESVATWEDAKKAIRNEFSPTLPAYQLYQLVFATRQDASTPTGLFVAEKRALLAQVVPPDTESRQVDFIYGLLRLDIRDRVPRKKVRDFATLIEAAREVEATLKERSRDTQAVANTEKPKTTKEKPRVKCSYCRNPGHDITVCRKRERAETEEKTKGEKNGLKCYGCGKPGVIRRNCPTCTSTREAAPSSLSFNAFNLAPTDRPAVDITIGGVQGTAFLDSGAKTSLASPKLYELLRKQRFSFTKKVAKVILADGRAENKTIYTTIVPVTLKGRTFKTPFVYTESGPEAVTLLGVDFAKLARLVVDYHHHTYHFYGSRHEVYHFIQKEAHDSCQIGNFVSEDCKTGRTHPLMLKGCEMESQNPEQVAIMMDDSSTNDLEDLFKSDEWLDLLNNYGPMISPIAATPATTAPVVRCASQQPRHGTQNPGMLSPTKFQWMDAVYAINEAYEDVPMEIDLFPRMEFASLNLRIEDEGNALSAEQQSQLNLLLSQFKDCFEEHGPAGLLQGEEPIRKRGRPRKTTT